MFSKNKKLLLVGGRGMLAGKISSVAPQNYQITAVDLPSFDITDRDLVLACVEALRPDVIVNCAAYTNVDGCETEQSLANLVNGVAVGYLSEAAKRIEAVLVHISTDYVFDGLKCIPYTEVDLANPRSAYGRSKLLGEELLITSGLDNFFVVRTSWLYGPGGSNFVETIIRLAKEKSELRVVADQVGSPTYTGDLAAAIFNLLSTSSPFGIYHFTNKGQCSWYEFSLKIIALAKRHGELLMVESVLPTKTEDYPLPAERPKFSVLSIDKYQKMTGLKVPDWSESLAKYFAER